MKRFLLLFLLLALLLSLTGCFTITGDTTDTSPEGKQEEPEEQHLTADVDETQVWQRTAGAPWTGGEPQTVSADFERISGAAAQGMTVGQELLLLDFMDFTTSPLPTCGSLTRPCCSPTVRRRSTTRISGTACASSASSRPST